MTFTAPTFTAPSPADLKEFVTTNFEHGASARIDDQDPDEGSVTIEVDFPNGGNLVIYDVYMEGNSWVAGMVAAARRQENDGGEAAFFGAVNSHDGVNYAGDCDSPYDDRYDGPW
jgi:hypothetical protein